MTKIKKITLLITILNIVIVNSFLFAQTLITLRDNAKVYEIPDINSKVLATASKNTVLKTTGIVRYPTENDRYFRVVYNNQEGWIFNTLIVYNDQYYSAIRQYEHSAIPKKQPYVEVVDNTAAKSIRNTNELFPPSTVHNPYDTRVINMKKQRSGTFIIPCKVNGLKMDFIFDTGASDVTISLTEALFMLKNNYLKESDIYGIQEYQMANGEIEEGALIIIRELEFEGYKLKNVRASISPNLEAPLLLGQSAISMLGTIQIDYYNNTLTIVK